MGSIVVECDPAGRNANSRLVFGSCDDSNEDKQHQRCRQRQVDTPRHVSPCSSTSSERESTALVVGKYINIEDEYHVDPQILGSGHEGSVRECVNRATGCRFAVKSIRKSDPAVKPDCVSREVALLRNLSHQSIIRLVDVVEDASHVHLVTDLCQGRELFDRIVEKSSENNVWPCFAEDAAARTMYQILSAVSHMHERGIVHRDLKPENILFETTDEDSPVKIIDFGLSRRHNEVVDRPMSSLVGSPYYVAPEVLRKRYDRSCDLWSVGVISYILLSGYPPFNGATNRETHESVLRGRYEFHTGDWKDISPEAMDFVRRLLQMDPRRRMTAHQALSHPWIVKHVCAR
jgi:serine/threonine protein kinase